ncbi:MAG: hypothetical protein DDT32_01952 [Syntrophomonadaceae bacterium]|nr:hypothetical protein [Bacillota bacterium]
MGSEGVSKGQLKSDKMQREVNNSAIQNPQSKLPDGWKWVKLGEVCEVEKGKTPSESQYAEKGVRIVKYRDITDYRRINWEPGFRSFVSPDFSQSLKPLTPKTTLIGADAHDPSSIGKKVAYVNAVPEEIGICYYSGELIGVRVVNDNIIDPYWPFLWFISDYGYQGVQDFVDGVHLNKGQAVQIPIPLPPIDDQQRIAAKLQGLMQEVERARTACEKQLEAAKALPAAYLRQVFESEEAEKSERKKLGEVCEEFLSGGTPSTSIPEYWGGDIPWITGADVSNFWVSGGRKFITEDGLKNSATHLVKKNTVLIVTRTGVGKVGIAANDLCFSQDITGVVCGSEILPEYLVRLLLLHGDSLIRIQRGATIKGLTRSHIECIQIPIPALPVQQRIAAELKEKMAQVEKLRTSIEKQLEVINALPQAILRKAFEGRL